MQFSPDGRWLATASTDGDIKLWDISPGGGMKIPLLREDLTGDEDAAVSIALNPDGNRMAVASQNGYAAIYDLDQAKRLFLIGDAQLGPVHQITYSPDGSSVATCRFDGPFQIWDTERGTELLRLDDLTDDTCAFNYHPDGKSIYLGFLRNEMGWHQELDLPVLELGSLI